MSEYNLTSGIIKLSESNRWDKAKLEWVLDEVYESDEPDRCLCGHFPIIEICIISNRLNSNSAIVGNCCVKKFIGLPSDRIFSSVKNVRKDIEKSLNSETIQHAFDKNWINDWEYNFYIDTMRKRKLSEKQFSIRIKINGKILNKLKRTTTQ